MTDSINIRTVRPDDAPAIAHIHADTWRLAYRGIVPDDALEKMSYERTEPRWREWLAKAKTDPHAVVLLAERLDGKAVGFAWGGPRRAGNPNYDAELYAIYIRHEFQGRGVGRRLVAEAARRLLADGFDSLMLWALMENPARAFYEKLGGMSIDYGPVLIGGVELPEVCYGWRDLRVLTEADRPQGSSSIPA